MVSFSSIGNSTQVERSPGSSTPAGSRSFFQGGFPSWISSARAVGTLAAAAAIAPPEGGYPSIYRPRNPRASVLYQLMEARYEDVKACREERSRSGTGSGEASSMTSSPDTLTAAL